MNKFIEWLKSFLPCSHVYIHDMEAYRLRSETNPTPAGRYGSHLLVCEKCGHKLEQESPQQREPWRDW